MLVMISLLGKRTLKKTFMMLIVVLVLGLGISASVAGKPKSVKQTVRTVSFQPEPLRNPDFPYSPRGLLLFSFSSTAILIASSVGLKIFLTGRRHSSRKWVSRQDKSDIGRT